MKIHLRCILSLLFIVGTLNAQNPWNLISAKEYSKDLAIFQAKKHLITNVLKVGDQTLQFEIDALASATSLEIITLWYKCESLGKEGLILGFYGSYWNDQGVPYTGYSFKDFPKEKALAFISKIDEVAAANNKWINGDDDVRNVYFTYEDLTMLMYVAEGTVGESVVRIFWGPFDASWNSISYERSKKRLLKKMN